MNQNNYNPFDVFSKRPIWHHHKYTPQNNSKTSLARHKKRYHSFIVCLSYRKCSTRSKFIKGFAWLIDIKLIPPRNPFSIYKFSHWSHSTDIFALNGRPIYFIIHKMNRVLSKKKKKKKKIWSENPFTPTTLKPMSLTYF